MKIKATVEILSSRPDIYGNTYHAFVFTDNRTGKTVKGMADGSNNVESIDYYWVKGNERHRRSIAFFRSELPIRRFNSLTKSWAYAGCTGEDLVKWIRRGLRKATP